ncbi:hypothetical protein GCM10020358_66940 [Amorphoplanes nipponensis]|uniref:Uncharacterized protein n=1 Tax=Actinoplanes nipponensis TaxID=135950 RepID=A0A919MXW6_9ACTN|nr:hypothetical protein [Actinoplanes nipponensis]GIE53810.1 hypothetical protein Ani05nite_73440 [Actinoplanes nipponensis]
MASWSLVPCLVTLRSEFNQVAPGRDKSSDGSIGDTAHAQSSSDHNPDETGSTPYEDADSINEVHAIDVDRDLRTPGWTMPKAVEIIVVRHRQGRDDRLQNVIYNRRIWSRSWGWTARAYTGSNAHTQHAHFSARYTTAQERDTRPWGLLEAEEDDMATITQSDFNARMDAWWNSRMSPNAEDNPQRAALRVAPWQQTVGRTGRSTHEVVFTDMLALLQQAAGVDPEQAAKQLLAGLDDQAVLDAAAAALADPERSSEQTAAMLRTALGDRAQEVGRLLAG